MTFKDHEINLVFPHGFPVLLQFMTVSDVFHHVQVRAIFLEHLFAGINVFRWIMQKLCVDGFLCDIRVDFRNLADGVHVAFKGCLIFNVR